jgi:hypothetical protein
MLGEEPLLPTALQEVVQLTLPPHHLVAVEQALDPPASHEVLERGPRGVAGL